MKKSLPAALRICFVTATTEYGYLRTLCKNLRARGHDVTIISTQKFQGPANQVIDGISIHYLEGQSFYETMSIIKESVLDRLEQLLIEKPFDIIHCVDDAGLHVALNKKELKINLAVDVKAIQLDLIFGILGLTEDTLSSYIGTIWSVGIKYLRSYFGSDHKMIKNADGVFVTSQQQLEILERYYMIPARKIHIIPFGTDAKPAAPVVGKLEILKRYEIDTDSKLILTITPLVNVEETKNLLTAFVKVVIKKPKTALIVLGEGPKKKELEFHALNLALGSKVWFIEPEPGSLTDDLINACDIYVNLFSRSSGFEPTVLEAMACSKAVIASEVGTSSNVIENGVDGFLLRPTDIPSLSQLLLQLVSGQVDTELVGQRARQKILKMFDPTRMVDQTIQAYKAILNSTGRYSK